MAALGLSAGIAPAAEFLDLTAILAATTATLAAGLLVLAIAWRLPDAWLGGLICLGAGPLVGVMNVELYRVVRWGGPAFDDLQPDVIFGFAIGAFWAVVVALTHAARLARAYDAPDTLQRYVGGVLLLAAAILGGFFVATRPGERWSWGVGGALLFALGMSFVLVAMRRRALRRKWLARVTDGREADWSIASRTAGDDALPPLQQPREGIDPFERVLVYSSGTATGSAFRSAPTQVRVALV